VAAYANDDHTICAVNAAVEAGLIEATLIGDEKTIAEVCKAENININNFKIIQEAEDVKAAAKACDLINAGEGDILMKGLLPTDKYMRAILNKERGLCPPNVTLAHVAVMQNPNYHKLMVVSDCAIIPLPDLKQKQTLLKYVTTTAKAIGVTMPKVALVCATEQMSAGIPACVDAAIIAKMADRGQIKGCMVDGPLSLDLALDAETVAIKKLVSPVAGDADCLVFPNLESANVFYKCNTKFDHAEVGAILMGAKVPCVLSSRGDSAKTKLYSIALAAMLA
jgi:Phosphotransacetylase